MLNADLMYAMKTRKPSKITHAWIVQSTPELLLMEQNAKETSVMKDRYWINMEDVWTVKTLLGVKTKD